MAALDERLGRRPRLAKLVRYSAASVAGVVTSQVVLLGCVFGLGMAAAWANVIAVVVGAIPNYLINRAWTFGKQGKHSMYREVLPFWGMALLGLGLSTIAVAWADTRYDGSAIALSGANIGSFGVLWVGRFFILDRVLFAPLADLVEELVEHHEHEAHHAHPGWAISDGRTEPASDGDGAPTDAEDVPDDEDAPPR